MIIPMLQRRKPRLRPAQGHRVAKKQVMGLSKVWLTPGCALSWISHTDSPIDTHACTLTHTHSKTHKYYTYMNPPHTEAHSLNNHMQTHADKHTHTYTQRYVHTNTQTQMHTNAHRHALYMHVPTTQTHTCRHTETCPHKDTWWG